MAEAATTAIAKVAVIGSGVMGAAIAAHVANAGVKVVLLDIVPKGEGRRSRLAEDAIQRLIKTRPAPLMSTRFAGRIQPGNLDDDLGLLKDCDWICEAIIENLELKQGLYRKLDEVRKPGSIVTSNTSTIPLNELITGLPAGFARDFAITHFFNPPRYMRLLELVAGPTTRAEAIAALREFGDVQLGKEVVAAKDTPGFIANRIGILWSTVAMQGAFDLDLTVEEADAIVGRPMGIPKTGMFGLADLTGLDLGPHIMASMLSLVPKSDALAKTYRPDHPLAKLTTKLIAEGYTGRKGKGGFYRNRGKEAIDLKSGEFRPRQKASLESVRAARGGLRALAEHPDKGGRYAWLVLSRVLSYAADLVPEIADDVLAVDTAMKTGYAWKQGPFEQIDQLGSGWFAEKLAAEGLPVPKLVQIAAGRPFYREDGDKAYYLTTKGDYAEIPSAPDAWMLADKKRGKEPIAVNKSASLWDIGDGVACLEFHSKMNAIDGDIVNMVREAAKIDRRGFKALVIANDADNFSVGANIGLALFAANIALWPLLENGTTEGQNAFLGLKYAPFPVVAAPAGMALGGGCEVCLHADAIEAHVETYMGLVETGVGLIPSWGGCKELLFRTLANKRRPGGPMPAIAQAFETISMAKVATSAAEARDMNYLRPADGITMNRRRLVPVAKARALSMVAGYKPPEPPEAALPGPTAKAALDLAVEGLVIQGKATAYDGEVAAALARVLSGGDTDVTETVTEKDMLALERQAFLGLIRKGPTLDRIAHMLETGKPLRN